jgi:hypothetical protein
MCFAGFRLQGEGSTTMYMANIIFCNEPEEFSTAGFGGSQLRLLPAQIFSSTAILAIG